MQQVYPFSVVILNHKIVLQMKQNWWLLSSAALLGGGVALIGSAVIQWSNPSLSALNGSLPTHQVSYAGGLLGDMNTDFVGAADRSVNCVVHVKTESTVSPAYNPWFDFFWVPTTTPGAARHGKWCDYL
jgi:hypothetical protein